MVLEWIGLRPGRQTLRVERENRVTINGKHLAVGWLLPALHVFEWAHLSSVRDLQSDGCSRWIVLLLAAHLKFIYIFPYRALS